MKKLFVVLAIAASFCSFVGCASNKAQEPAPAAVDTSAPVQHHDYKGETGK